MGIDPHPESLSFTPLGYPTIFNSADAAVITKMDLAAVAGFAASLPQWNIEAVRPGITIFDISAKSSEGLAQYLGFLEERRQTIQPRNIDSISVANSEH